MSDKKQAVQASPNVNTGSENLFGKQNYTWILIGIAVIAVGLFMMAGGGSSNPAEFDKNEVYSTTRITIAPILILLGLGIEIFAIFRKPKA